jgi:hypothetical protein
MKSRGIRWMVLSSLLLPLCALSAYANSVDLGTAGSSAVLAGSTVTNTSSSVLSGNLDISPGCALSLFPPGSVSGPINVCNAASGAAQRDLMTGFDEAMGLNPTATPTGTNLGGLVQTPGLYFFAGSAQMTGTTTSNNIPALNSITLNNRVVTGCGTTVVGNGAVTLKNGAVGNCGSNVPEPGTMGLLGTGLAILWGAVRRKIRVLGPWAKIGAYRNV